MYSEKTSKEGNTMLATTKQVRKLMYAAHGGLKDEVWTNKVKSADGTERSVKCYYYGACCDKLVEELKELAGAENVKVTRNGKVAKRSDDYLPFSLPGADILPGIVVRCKLK